MAGYTADRYTADLRITVPQGFRVVGNGTDLPSETAAGEKVTFHSRTANPSFRAALPSSRATRSGSRHKGHHHYVPARRQAAAQAVADELGKAMTYFTGLYGLPVQAGLTVVETESGAANGYSAPGVLFLSPKVWVPE